MPFLLEIHADKNFRKDFHSYDVVTSVIGSFFAEQGNTKRESNAGVKDSVAMIYSIIKNLIVVFREDQESNLKNTNIYKHHNHSIISFLGNSYEKQVISCRNIFNYQI